LSLQELTLLLQQLQTPPELLITDFQLGGNERGSDALELTRQHSGNEIPTIVLTGDTSALPALLFNRRGIQLLNKPVDGPTLAAAVNDAFSEQ
jgi:DNA-binding response OmpR family regulator